MNSNVMKFLHLWSVIIGFGGMSLAGLISMQARRAEGETRAALLRIVENSAKLSEIFVYLVPVFGFAILGMNNESGRMSETWVWASFVLWFLYVGIIHGVIRPGNKKLMAGAESGEEAPDLAAVAGRVNLFAGINNLLVVAAIALMVWQPGK